MLSSTAFTVTQKSSSFGLLLCHLGSSGFPLGLESYFNGPVDYPPISCTFLCDIRPSVNKQHTLLLIMGFFPFDV